MNTMLPIMRGERARLKCIVTGGESGPPQHRIPATPTNLDILATSDDTQQNLSWSQAFIPNNTQIWRSINGAAFVLIGTVAGAVTTFTDNNGMPVGDQWTYKVRGKIGSNFGSFSSTVSSLHRLSSAAAVISFPDVVIIYGTVALDGSAALTTLSLPILHTIKDEQLPAGQAGALDCSSTPISTIVLTSLRTTSAEITFFNSVNLVTVSLPSLLSVGIVFSFGTCTNLTSISVNSSLIIPDGGFIIDYSSCALNAASINAILAIGVASGVSADDFELAGGTNAAPTGQGVADTGTLIGLGNTVNTN